MTITAIISTKHPTTETVTPTIIPILFGSVLLLLEFATNQINNKFDKIEHITYEKHIPISQRAPLNPFKHLQLPFVRHTPLLLQ